MLEKFGIRARFSRDDEYNRIDSPMHARLFGLTMDLPPDPLEYLEDGQVIPLGMIRFTALHVPGHSSGSLAFYSSDLKAVFTGDALFAGSIGRTDLQGGDFKTLISSIRNKLFTLPDETIVYPGHGESTTIKAEKETNPYFINS
jgi:glyoxylase-like metal-dependent hydrolase (beta-lactamase superfamily II)